MIDNSKKIIDKVWDVNPKAAESLSKERIKRPQNFNNQTNSLWNFTVMSYLPEGHDFWSNINNSISGGIRI